MKKRDILWLALGAGMAAYGSTAVQSGNWNDAATWDSGGVPAASVGAIINGSRTVTVQATTNATAKNILLGAGSAGTLTVNGDFIGGDWNAIVLGTWNSGNGNGTLNISGGTVGSTSARQKITIGEKDGDGIDNYNQGTIQISSGGSLYAKETRLFTSTNMLGTAKIDVQGGTLNADGFRLYIGDQSGSADTARLEVGGVSTVSMGSLWLGSTNSTPTSGRLVVSGSDVDFSMTGGCTMRSGSVLDFNFDADGISAVNADAFWYPDNVVTANVVGVSGVANGSYDLLVGNQIGSGGDRDIVFNVSGFDAGTTATVVKDTTSGLVYRLDVIPEPATLGLVCGSLAGLIVIRRFVRM